MAESKDEMPVTENEVTRESVIIAKVSLPSSLALPARLLPLLGLFESQRQQVEDRFGRGTL